MSYLVSLSYLTKPQLLAYAKKLEKEVSRLRHELTQNIAISEPDSTEPAAIRVGKDEHYRIYIVWTIGTYPGNGTRHLDIRSVTTSEAMAKMHSKILRRDKTDNYDTFDRVVIEPRVANHLYGACLREYMVNTGQM